jgi:hypothetical protein
MNRFPAEKRPPEKHIQSRSHFMLQFPWSWNTMPHYSTEEWTYDESIDSQLV